MGFIKGKAIVSTRNYLLKTIALYTPYIICIILLLLNAHTHLSLRTIGFHLIEGRVAKH